MHILNLLDELEKLLTELLLWIVFIPKTLFKIITNPSWVPNYINEQLEKKEGRFRNYMSPVILFLTNSLILFFLFEYVIKSFVGGFYLPKLLNKALIISNGADIESKLTDVNTLIMALGFMLLPILFAVFIELFRKKGFSRAHLHRAIYIQAYYFSPIFFVYFIVIIFYNLLPFDIFIDYGSFILFTLLAIWFSAVQIRLLRHELMLGKAKSFFAYIAMVLLLCIVTISYDAVASIKSRASESSYYQGVILPKSGTYIIFIKSRSFETNDYDINIDYRNQKTGGRLTFKSVAPMGMSAKLPMDYTEGDTLDISIYNDNGSYMYFDMYIEFNNDFTTIQNDSLNLNNKQDKLLDNSFYYDIGYPDFKAPTHLKIHPNIKLTPDTRFTDNGEVIVWRTTIFDIWNLFYRMIWVFMLALLIFSLIKGMFSKSKNKIDELSNTTDN